MSTFTDRLAIIIDADGKGAIREFEKVDAVSGKALATTDDKLAKVSGGLRTFGLGAVTAGALVVGGMSKMAQAAGDFGESMSAAGVVFGDGIDVIKDFGETASKTAGLSKKAATDGAVTFGTFGKAAGLAGKDLAGFSTEMVQLAGDLASFKNTSPEQAIEAIGAALRGEAEPIRNYGVLLDDATLRQEAFALGLITTTKDALTPQQKVLAAQSAILKQTTDAQGDYLRTGDSLANQQKSVKAEIENLTIAIGTGALPVFKNLTAIVGGAVTKFNELPGPVKDTVGQFAAIGGVGAVAVGALSLVVGQLDKARDMFVRFGRDGEGNLTKVGFAMKGLAVGAGVIGGLQLLSNALDAIGNKSAAVSDALRRYELAKNLDDVTDAFKRQLSANENEGFLPGFLQSYREIVINGEKVETSIKAVDKSLEELLSQDPSKARELFDAIKAGAAEADAAGNSFALNGEIVSEWQDRIDSAVAVQEKQTAATGDQTAATEAQTDAVKDTTTELKRYTDAVKAATDPVFAVVDAQRKLSDANDKVTEAQLKQIEAIKKYGPASGEASVATRDLEDAQREAVLAAFDLNGAFGVLSDELAKNPELLGQVGDALDALKAQYPQLAGAIDLVKLRAVQATGAMNDFAGNYEVQVTANFDKFYAEVNKARAISRQYSLGGNSPGQNNADRQGAVGAVVAAGETLLVGENGPEIFQAGSSGYIVPNNRLGGSSSPSWAGNTQAGDTYTFNVNMVAGDKASIDRMIADSLTRYSRNGGVVRANVVAV